MWLKVWLHCSVCSPSRPKLFAPCSLNKITDFPCMTLHLIDS